MVMVLVAMVLRVRVCTHTIQSDLWQEKDPRF
jgi:hypothetical protein